MSFGKFILIPIFISFQAFVMMLIFPKVEITPAGVGGPGLMAWVAFQAWAMYFLAGGTPKMGLKTLIGYLGGIIASIAILELAVLLSGSMGWYFGFAVAVFIIVVPVISAQKVPWIDFVPSYFIGAGVFFGIMTLGKGVVGGEMVPLATQWFGPEGARWTQGYVAVMVPEMIACALGLVWGWVTVSYQTWYTAKVGGGEAAE